MTTASSDPHAAGSRSKPVQTLHTVAVRFAGDSGDGVQLIGSQFTTASALCGNDLATLPDYPAEIRAPASTLAGVSGFQINFSSDDVYTPGDNVQALVAMNPAALKVNLPDLDEDGLIVANTDGFTPTALKIAGYASNPLEDGSLSRYRVVEAPITKLTIEAVEPVGLKHKDAERCKNLFALGLVCWLYDRSLDSTTAWLKAKFAKRPDLGVANETALRAGYHFGETSELFPVQYHVAPAHVEPGTYRKIRGSEGICLGLIAAAWQAGKQLFYATYPITPASDMLHEFVKHKNFGVRVFQAEDEIAAMCAALGAAYGGTIAATGTSGPGMDLKSEALGLAVMLELPCVIVDVQRGGPSTGLPTKSEQTDLLQAIGGRHGECPVPVLAAQSPSDCFRTAFEAVQIAVRFMTPVIVLSDGYLSNGAEPWKVPDVAALPRIPIEHADDPETFQPYQRNDDLARPWAVPGTAGLAHRVGGLEKQDVTGAVSHDPVNHERMVRFRADKIARVADTYEPLHVLGERTGRLIVVSWGSTYGAVRTAVERCQRKGMPVSQVHLRHMHPLPRDLGPVLAGFEKVLVPELNLGQLRLLLRAEYLVDAVGLNKVQGRPFTVAEITKKIEDMVREG